MIETDRVSRLQSVRDFLLAVRRTCLSLDQNRLADQARQALEELDAYVTCLPKIFEGARTAGGIDVPFELRSVEFPPAQRWSEEERRVIKEHSGIILVELRQMIEFLHLSSEEAAERSAKYDRVSFVALQRRKPLLYTEPGGMRVEYPKKESDPNG